MPPGPRAAPVPSGDRADRPLRDGTDLTVCPSLLTRNLRLRHIFGVRHHESVCRDSPGTGATCPSRDHSDGRRGTPAGACQPVNRCRSGASTPAAPRRPALMPFREQARRRRPLSGRAAVPGQGRVDGGEPAPGMHQLDLRASTSSGARGRNSSMNCSYCSSTAARSQAVATMLRTSARPDRRATDSSAPFATPPRAGPRSPQLAVRVRAHPHPVPATRTRPSSAGAQHVPGPPVAVRGARGHQQPAAVPVRRGAGEGVEALRADGEQAARVTGQPPPGPAAAFSRPASPRRPCASAPRGSPSPRSPAGEDHEHGGRPRRPVSGEHELAEQREQQARAFAHPPRAAARQGGHGLCRIRLDAGVAGRHRRPRS